MTVQGQIEILQAYERGEEIEIKDNEGVWWTLRFKYPTNYEFDFRDYDYRVKSKPKRWRADEGERYYYLNSRLVIVVSVDTYSCADDSHFNAGNYFRTAEVAEKARELLKGCLTKFYEEKES